MEDREVSVVPLCGVAFKTLMQLFGPEPGELFVPLSIVTDSDPALVTDAGEDWQLSTGIDDAFPQRDNKHRVVECGRVRGLRQQAMNRPNVQVFASEVALEYDLARAGEHNAQAMALAWETAHTGQPQRLTLAAVRECARDEDRSLMIWRELCLRRGGSVSKAAFCQQLAFELSHGSDPLYDKFVVPKYISQAIDHAMGELPHRDED